MKCLTVLTTTYKSTKYLSAYFKAVFNLDNLEQIKVILLMNEPDDDEKKLVNFFCQQQPEVFRIIEINQRESIGASINRGLLLADTYYVSLLDVDDICVPNSFVRQISTLNRYPNVDFTYGDFMTVSRQGATQGKYVEAIEFDPVEFTRGCYASPTQVFRTHLINRIGGFDEQLKSGGDFDFQVRAAANCIFKKTPGLMLYYTKYPGSGSASSSILQPIERTIVELRYGIFDKIDYRYIKHVREYHIAEIYLYGSWHPVCQFIPDYQKFIQDREYLKPIGVRKYRIAQYKRYVSSGKKFFKGVLRSLVKRIGLYNLLIPVYRKIRK